MEAKNGEADIVIVAACGERAGEVVEILKEFPELEDPKTGRSLMERSENRQIPDGTYHHYL